MEVTAKALAVCKRGCEEESCSPLCTTLKDHNNYFIQSKVDKAFSHSLQLLQERLIEEPMKNLHASERVVRLQVVAGSFTTKLLDRLILSLSSIPVRNLIHLASRHVNSRVADCSDDKRHRTSHEEIGLRSVLWRSFQKGQLIQIHVSIAARLKNVFPCWEATISSRILSSSIWTNLWRYLAIENVSS